MDWNVLLSLICPIMMIFCLKGMFGKHSHCAKDTSEQPQVSSQDLQSMNAKITELIEQNAYLLKEVQSMKETRSILKTKDAQ